MLNYYKQLIKYTSYVSPQLASNIAFNIFCTPFNKKLREREVEVLKNAKCENVDFEDSYIKKYVWGEGYSKTAFLVHGWESNAGSLGAFVELLNQHQYRVVAFDYPAHGQSGGKQTTIFKNSDAASVICRELNHIDLAITHSMGSVVLMNTLLHHKNISLDKLIMITTPNDLQKAFNDLYALLNINQKVIDKIEKNVEKKFNLKISDISVSNLCHNIAINNSVIIHDVNDKVIPFESAVKVANNLNNCRLVPIENAGHYKILWDSRVVDLVKAELESKI